MIQIIKKGDIPWKYEWQCDTCGCIFRFDNEDVNCHGPMLGHGIECPECGTEQKLPNDLDEILVSNLHGKK